MERFVRSLAAVIEANQRILTRAAIRQLVLVIATGVGLTRLSGAWWCLCLTGFVAMLAWGVFLLFALKWQSEIMLEPPWRGVGMEPWPTDGMHHLELHLIGGGTQVLRVPKNLFDEVTSAAKEAGIELITDEPGLRELREKNIRLNRIKDVEALVPHVPDAELRDALTSTLAKVREVEPPGSNDLLDALRRLLEYERKEQKKGPRSTPSYEREIRESLAAFAKLLA